MIRISTCILTLFAATPLQAHWQYTKWGMTPEEVVAASQTAVHVRADDPARAEPGLTMGSEGTYTIGSISLPVTFYYKDGGLQMVKLTAHNDPTCFALGARLGGQYGQPAGFENSPIFHQRTWKDSERGNRVEFFTTGDFCSVKYTDLDRPSESAL